MHHSLYRLAVPCGLCAAVALAFAEPPRTANPPWAEKLLAEVKLTPDKAQIDPGRWTGGGEYRLNTFQKLWDDWRLIDSTARSTADDFLTAADSFEKVVARAAPLLDVKVPNLSDIKPKDEPATVALQRAIADLHAALGKPLSKAQSSDLEMRTKTVPEPVARAAALLLRAVPDALKKREQAFAKLGGPDKIPAAFRGGVALALNADLDADTLRLVQGMDLASLVQGSLLLARAMDRAETVLKERRPGKFSFAWDTPIGQIALNGDDNDRYGPGPYLLIIDTGGNDHYESGGAAASPANPIGLLLDLAGNDCYESKTDGAFGAGVFGYGFHLDAAGNDSYKAPAMACGAGVFGIGVLLDRSGEDRYEINHFGEGAAYHGIGVLSDLAGDDVYQCFFQAQGFGGVRGIGVLVDREGNDTYEANDTKIDYPSPQTKEHNTSLAQGCAFGRRAHPGDGHSLAGGVGLLVDGKGNDHYKCGVFGQGTSYWYGLGMLVDCGGDDVYEGVWYVQGASAHYGVAALVDLAGNDKYKATATQSQGHGHDYSIGWLHDVKGNDLYDCPSNAMGAALWNGLGILWDEAGDDTYKTGDASLGFAGAARPGALCLGLFIDGGGKNTFPEKGRARQGSTWVQPANKDLPQSLGLGTSR